MSSTSRHSPTAPTTASKAGPRSGATADNGNERAADSPGDKLRVTYATAASELGNIDLAFVKRSRATALALSRALFGRASAMAVLLEVGSS